MILFGWDHAGFKLKQFLLAHLATKKITTRDFGCYNEESIDYPDYAHAVAELVASNKADLGVLICGSANGVAITANKHQKVRAAICWNAEIASLAVQHNDANICCIPARFTSETETNDIMEAFFSAEFEGGRHANRVNKIACS